MSEFDFEIKILNESDQMAVVNRVFDLGLRLEVDRVELCKAVTIISELATNLIKYARKGSLEIKLSGADHKVLTIVSSDEGPGIESLDLAMKDHYSTKATFGLGLGSVKRMSDTFEIESSENGTKIIATKILEGKNG